MIILLFRSPESSRPIWASGYMCSGSESRLFSCHVSFSYGYAPNCDHSSDATLTCNSKNSLFQVLKYLISYFM